MARNLIQERARLKEADALTNKLTEIESSCQVIRAKSAELTEMRVRFVAGAKSDEHDQADVDKLDALTPKVAALAAAVETYLGK